MYQTLNIRVDGCVDYYMKGLSLGDDFLTFTAKNIRFVHMFSILFILLLLFAMLVGTAMYVGWSTTLAQTEYLNNHEMNYHEF